MDSWIIERFVQDIFFLRDFHAPLLLLSVFIGSWAPIIRLELQAPFEILIVRSDFRSKCQCEKKSKMLTDSMFKWKSVWVRYFYFCSCRKSICCNSFHIGKFGSQEIVCCILGVSSSSRLGSLEVVHWIPAPVFWDPWPGGFSFSSRLGSMECVIICHMSLGFHIHLNWSCANRVVNDESLIS